MVSANQSIGDAIELIIFAQAFKIQA